MGTLIIFSGLPGVGKSTVAARLATRLRATYLRIDTVEAALREVCDVVAIDGRGYELCQRIAADNLAAGNVVIADCVNDWRSSRRAWQDVAQRAGAAFVNVEVICSDLDEHHRRVQARGTQTWAAVSARTFDAWDEDRVLVDTARESVDDAVEVLAAAAMTSMGLQR